MTTATPRPSRKAPEREVELEAALDALIARVEAETAAMPPPTVEDERLARLLDGVMDHLPAQTAAPRRVSRMLRTGGWNEAWSGWGRLALPAVAGLVLGILAGPWLSTALEQSQAVPLLAAATVSSSQETPLVTLFLTSSVPALEL